MNDRCGLQGRTTAHLASHSAHPTPVDCESELAALLVLCLISLASSDEALGMADLRG